MNDKWRPDRTQRESGEPWSGGWASSRTGRALAVVYAGLVGLSQSRGLFAVIGAAVATSIFVLFSWLPGNDAPLQSQPTFPDRTGGVVEKAGTGADSGAAQSQGSTLESGRPSTQPPLPPAPLGGSAPAQPAPEEISPAQEAYEQPVPGEPAPKEPTPRTPHPVTPVAQETRVVLSTKAGRESVGIDRWQRVSSESDDLRMDESGIYTTQGAQLSVIEDPHGTISYRDCAQRTTWVTRADFTALHKGSKICARSHTGNYAALKVVALPRAARDNVRFVFLGTTWQFPGQQAPPPPASG